MKLSVQQLTATLGGRKILDAVSLDIPEKKLVGIIGPNGSGKSTLLRCIYRALKPSGGAVFLDGVPLQRYSIRESSRKMAVVAQHNAYSFDFTVWDIVMMGRSPHKGALESDGPRDRRIVTQSLEAVGMSGFEGRIFSELSGGEQQRVILARALAQQTPCLILDEPTNHLDIRYQLELMDLVCGLDRTVIAALHDLNLAALYCDRLIAIKDGKILGAGAPDVLLTPDLIRRLYDVDALVRREQDGSIQILYRPGIARTKSLSHQDQEVL